MNMTLLTVMYSGSALEDSRLQRWVASAGYYQWRGPRPSHRHCSHRTVTLSSGRRDVSPFLLIIVDQSAARVTV
jgi:hypothetical protein